MRLIVPTPPPLTGDQGRGLAKHELGKPIYHSGRSGLIGRVMGRIGDWLNSLLHHGSRGPVNPETGDGGSSGGGGGLIAVIMIAVVLAIIIGLAVWWLLRNRRLRSDGDALLEHDSTAAEHRSAAELLAESGQWAAAIRERLRGIARDLEERGILEPRPGRTADELGEEAAQALPELAGELAQGIRVFDDVWYGGRPGTPDGYRALTDLETRLRATAPRAVDEPVPPSGFRRPW